MILKQPIHGFLLGVHPSCLAPSLHIIQLRKQATEGGTDSRLVSVPGLRPWPLGPKCHAWTPRIHKAHQAQLPWSTPVANDGSRHCPHGSISHTVLPGVHHILFPHGKEPSHHFPGSKCLKNELMIEVHKWFPKQDSPQHQGGTKKVACPRQT